MQAVTIHVNKLIAEEGKILTDGKEIFGKVIFLGKDRNISEFYEITKEEYEKINALPDKEEIIE